MDLIFRGNWLVNYDVKEFNYPEILITLAKIQDHFYQNDINFNSINIIFNKNGKKNYFYQEKSTILLSFCSINKEFEENKAKPGNLALLEALKKPVKSIDLLFPRLDNDPRWKTMALPAGQLLLASSLRAAGFEATPLPLVLPLQNRPSGAVLADLTGITLFEDLLPLLGPFLAVFRVSYKGIIAAGGPFPTLAPLAAIYHLPPVNLFVRGEAELALPEVLNALNRGDARAFSALDGVFWQRPGLIAMANFNRVNRPDDLGSLPVDLDFLKAPSKRGETATSVRGEPAPALRDRAEDHMEHGLEMNFSRGCCRGCMFCCRVQGAKFRKLPPAKADELLGKYIEKTHGALSATARTLNINDDDILQDPSYAAEIFNLVKKHGLRIYGIQTSTASLVKSDGSPDLEALDSVSDPGLFVDNRPLLWLGSDAFLTARARRLGKKLPPAENFIGLLAEMERRGLRHFHYWISSDGDSTWEEFVEELALIFGFFRDFPGFGLLAHAPFIVPYPSSRLFRSLPAGTPGLKIKLELPAPDPRFRYRVIDRLETRWPQLNNLLQNKKAGGEKGFFDFLKEKDLIAAAQLTFHFLKQEQFQGLVNNLSLQRAQKKLEIAIENLIEFRNA